MEIRDIDATTKLGVVIGQPIKHSKSPAIYNTAFQSDELNAVYLAIETSEEDTVDRLNALKNLDVIGINITMPGKHKALQAVDQIDESAQYVQAINTIVKEQGKWVGYNTDGIGFWLSAKKAGYELEQKRITVFGTGSTSRVIVSQAIIEGVQQIDVIGRNLERPLEIKKVIEKLNIQYPDRTINLVDLHKDLDVKESLEKADIVVQSTSVGLSPNDQTSILKDENWLDPSSLVMEVVYNPEETMFINQAKNRGCMVVYGIRMLVNQAFYNYKLFTGLEMNVEEVLRNLT